MSQNTAINKYKESIKEIIFRRLDKDDCIVFLFGTFATGNTVKGSDIDIGILSNKAIPASDFLEIQEKLNADVPTLRKIDFVDFANIDKTIRDEAIKEIEIWHTGKNCRELLKSLKPV